MKFLIPVSIVAIISGVLAWKYLKPAPATPPSEAQSMQPAVNPVAVTTTPPPLESSSTANPGTTTLPIPGGGATLPVNPINGGPGVKPIDPEQEARNNASREAAMHEETGDSAFNVQKQISEVVKLDGASIYGLMGALNEPQANWKAARIKYNAAVTAGKLPPEELEALAAELAADLKAKNTSTDARIKSVLGSEENQTQFKKFQDSNPERQQIGTLKKKFAAANAPMTEDQEQQIMDVIFSERKNMKLDYDYSDLKDTRPDKYTEENLALFNEQRNAAEQAITTRLEPVLTVPQREAFRQLREQKRNEEMADLEFAKALYASKEEVVNKEGEVK